jgi:WD40 repeat protein
MIRAQQAWQEGWAERVQELLDGQRPRAGQKDFRGFEWYYLWRVCRSDRLTFKGHRAQVYGLAYSPDGRYVASAEGAGWPGVKIWEAATGKELRTFGPHNVFSVAYSPDGRHLAVASADHTVTVWEAATGKEVRTLKGHTFPVFDAKFSPDGKRLASAGLDQAVKVWEVATGKVLLSVRGDVFRCVEFSPDGKRLAGAGSRAVKVWDAATGKEVSRFDGQGVFNSVAFSPDGRLLATADHACAVTLWEAATGKEARTLRGHSSSVDGLGFSPDGRRLASASFDRTVRVWDVATGREVLALKGHTGGVSCVAFSPDGRRLATAGDDRTVRLWEAASGQEVFTLWAGTGRPGQGGARSLAFSPDGRRLALAGGDGTAKVFEAPAGHKGPAGHPAAGVTGPPDGGRLPARDLAPGEVEALWRDLAGADAPRAYRALWGLAAAPKQVVPFLSGRVRPVPPRSRLRIAPLLADLDSDAFAVREKAMQELEGLGDLAEPALRRALAAGPSPEVAKRVHQLLERTDLARSPGRLRVLRALEVLEHIGTAEAAEVLRELAGGAPEARLTQEAQGALGRLARRHTAKP